MFASWIRTSWLRGSAEYRVRAAATRLERRGGTNMKESRKSPFDCQSAAVPGQNVCICATAIERTDKVVRTLRRAGGRCLGGERRTNSRVGTASTRTTTRQCNYRYRNAKAASCMCLMHSDGDDTSKQRGCTTRSFKFWGFVRSGQAGHMEAAASTYHG